MTAEIMAKFLHKRMKKRTAGIFFSLCFFSLFILLSLPVLAQTPPASPAGEGDLRLTTSPLPINLKTTPGQTVSASLKVKNDGTKTEKIKVSLMKFKADGTTGAPMLLEKETGDSFFDWVTFSDPTFTLLVNEWKTITATFMVPDTASFGYYYAIVFSRANEAVIPGERQTVIQGGTATLVLLEVQVPNARKEVVLQQFSADKGLYEFLPATFAVKLRNTGNVHVAPRGNIFLSQRGKDIATLEINPGKGSILPDSPRDFKEQWTDGFPVYALKMKDGQAELDAQGNQIRKLKWDWKDASKLRWGKYTAKLLLVYDDGQRDVPIEGEVSFWVVPWRLLGGALLIVIFVLIGLKSTLQSWYKRIRNLLGKE